MKNKLLFLIMILIGSSVLQAQEITIIGQVKDSGGNPLPGVNIMVNNSTTGTQTDFDGNYSIDAKKGNVLIFSFIGMITQKITIEDQTVIDVILLDDNAVLDEVVVVGYGSTAKKDISGSIATVKGTSILERSTTNISNALQGAVAGVSVTRNNSEPGSGNSIRIRGNTTLQGSSDPLILVDDVPVSSINDVPADQIASISILKDAAAAAIYGSRAAAGVIIITTKRAKNGIFSASYNGEYFINTPANKREVVGPARYQELINERLWNDNGNGTNQFPLYTEDVINAYKSGQHLIDRDAYPYTDWESTLLKKNSYGNRHTINVAGGSEKVRSSFSLGYENQDALYAYRNWTRYTARSNNDIRLGDKFGVTADFAIRIVEDERPVIDPTGPAYWSAPIFNAFHQDGRLAGGRNGGNPYAILHSGGFENNDTYNFTGKVGVFFKPIEDLKISLNFSPNYTFKKEKFWTKPVPFWEADDPDQLNPPRYINNIDHASLNESRTTTFTYTKQAFINYDKNFGDHNVSAVVGYEDFYQEDEGLKVKGDQFISADFPYLNQAPADRVFDNGTNINELAYVSAFGRVNYNYKNKYYLEGTVRHDGSSRFGSDYRWGTFPSISAAWTISNEDFMKPIKDKISFLKLKASYGTLGNDRLGNYLYLTVLQISNVLIDNGGSSELVRGLAQRYLTTPDIRWETTKTKNIGLEIGLFDSRLSLLGEYYIKDTEDMLLSLSVPDLVGFDDPTVNVGDMQTKGWEFTTTWNDNIGDDFKYSISFNIFDDVSKIGNINGKQLFSGITLSEEGSEFRELYGLVSDGLYQTQDEVDNSPTTSNNIKPGDIRYKDLSGPDGVPDGVINNFDRTFLGSSFNHYTFGGRINMGYKGFDFGLSFQGVGDKKFYFTQSILTTNIEVANYTTEFDGNFWSNYNTPEENSNVKYPRHTLKNNGNNYRFSDYWLKDGSYLKIKALTLGYSLPSQAIEKASLSKLRVYVTGTDLFSFDHLPDGVDPEQTSANSYYITKSVVFGLQVNF